MGGKGVWEFPSPGLEKFQSANWALRVSWAVVDPRSGKFSNPFPAQPLLEGYLPIGVPAYRGPPIQSYRESLDGRPIWAYTYRGYFKWLYLAYLSQARRGTVGYPDPTCGGVPPHSWGMGTSGVPTMAIPLYRPIGAL